MPSISVVVPVYNVEKYIHCCIDSILCQTFSDFELILVDDGSPDRCGQICDEYEQKDPRVRTIHQKNGGLGHARNVGMDLASGKYIIFLDSDDYWAPSTLEALYAEAEKNGLQVLLFGAMDFFDGADQPKASDYYKYTIQNRIVKNGSESLYCALNANEYYTQACMRFYNLDYIRSIGIRFDEGIIHEDVKFSFLACLFSDRVECIENQLYYRRYHAGSIMTSKSYLASAHGQFVAIEGLLEVFQSNILNENGMSVLERYIGMRVDMICDLFDKALRNDVGSALAIQKEARHTLKNARVISTLSRRSRISTYSMFLGSVVSYFNKVLKQIKR